MQVHTLTPEAPGLKALGSIDARMTPEDTVEAIEALGLNVIAVTDHNAIDGAVTAFNHAQRRNYQVEIYIGEEISTLDGHIIAIGIETPIDKQLSGEETIRRIIKQGGKVIIPHPMRKGAFGEDKIAAILNRQNPELKIHGVEILNASYYNGSPEIANEFLGVFSQKFKGQIAPIGSSDNHNYTPARALTGFTGNFLEALEQKNTIVVYPDIIGQLLIIQAAWQKFGDIISNKSLRYFLEGLIAQNSIPPEFNHLSHLIDIPDGGKRPHEVLI
ncbi:MAG: PHP domain-containing protein [Candidatus Roizmanbacteria bacterium]|nr:MAG: PHP domain-containing protein [Candidatus Roizmanbacteria bacterium]